MEGHLSNNLSIACTFTAPSCSGLPEVLWFRIKVNKTKNLCLGPCKGTESPGKFHLNGSTAGSDATLRIQRAAQDDSGVYYCGVAYQSSSSDKSKQTGSGTTLVVRASGFKATGSGLWLQSTLMIILSLYTICITILLVQTCSSTKKANHSSDTPSEEQKSRAFQALALEFNRRYRNENQETTFQEAQTNSAEDEDSIYQNA
uniref:immunoglobulin superfamily member 6-like n=1 Tax=Pristiophorus japonicus TaxID=55135 RepID=UPI00398ECE4A